MITSQAPAQQWAEKMFSQTTHDFGTVARGSKVEYRFKLKNLYEEDVHISSVRSSCGCTTPEVSTRDLGTFEEGDIIARFNTDNFLGQRSATLTVTFDKPFYAEVQLNVSGYIRSDVVLHPAAVELGQVAAGTPVEKRIEINYAGRDDWRITEVVSNNPHIHTQLAEKSRGRGSVTYELLVSMDAEAPTGYIKDALMLKTNDHRAVAFPVSVEGRILPEVTVTPDPLLLGTVRPGESVTKKLVVRGRTPFKILDITCPDGCFKFELPEGEKPLHMIPITFEAGTKPGKIACKIRIETDLNDGTTPEVLAHVQVIGAEGAAD